MILRSEPIRAAQDGSSSLHRRCRTSPKLREADTVFQKWNFPWSRRDHMPIQSQRAAPPLSKCPVRADLPASKSLATIFPDPWKLGGHFQGGRARFCARGKVR